ncbi:GIY-YIG nuclease family protein [Leptospira idonii]|uniref:GIY-YIG nuclease family protein n=1 Tax=Leptospira idonii TaxID=1193500 RepID=A0A4R9M067_9LEPT|nr:GIY-YIG nuclease family protein [Leptospira idonii]TGN19165.1 GIY-YIG nuclease family protein [Leptospira idonii]
MGRKITIFQIDDSETGPKTLEVGGSSLRAIYSPRSRLKDLLSRQEYENPGVYILKSFPTSATFNERVYIGEADPLIERLKTHLSDESKDFSECVAIYSSNSGELTKAHIKNMESKLYQVAINAKSSEIGNSNTPTASTLSEADEALVDLFIAQIKSILPLLGFELLIPATTTTSTQKINESTKYYINRKGLDATMIITDEGYVVLKGSTAAKDTTPSIGSYKEIREKLISTNIIVPKDDKLEFIEDTLFSSPSAASCVIVGTSSSGPEEWKTEKGIKLKDQI